MGVRTVTDYPVYPAESLRALLTAVRDTSWSWTPSEVPAVAQRLGWTLRAELPDGSAFAEAGFGLDDKAFRVSVTDGAVWQVVMGITGHAGRDDDAGQLFLSDAFVDALAVATEVLGEPSARDFGSVPWVRWRGPENTVRLERYSSEVGFVWVSNAEQDRSDALDAILESDE